VIGCARLIIYSSLSHGNTNSDETDANGAGPSRLRSKHPLAEEDEESTDDDLELVEDEDGDSSDEE